MVCDWLSQLVNSVVSAVMKWLCVCVSSDGSTAQPRANGTHKNQRDQAEGRTHKYTDALLWPFHPYPSFPLKIQSLIPSLWARLILSRSFTHSTFLRRLHECSPQLSTVTIQNPLPLNPFLLLPLEPPAFYWLLGNYTVAEVTSGLYFRAGGVVEYLAKPCRIFWISLSVYMF